MKTPFVGAVIFLFAANMLAQSAGAVNQAPVSEQPQDTPFSIVERDANSSTWQRTTYEQAPSGEWIPHVRSYQETATGLNFKNPDTGQWEESSEAIELVPGGAAAKHGQHKVIFAADLATFGAIDMDTPDGQRLQSHLLGLAYFDKASGQSVFIAETTNSIGQLVSSNEVWYDNAFTGVKAGVRYTNKRDGFEQDVILEEQPPLPEAYGLNSTTTILQAYTEFISPPTPTVSMSFIAEGAEQQLPDKTLAFTTMQIGRGRAFLMGNSSESAPVAKDWVTVEGRQFLIEEVPISQISDQLQALPPSASVRLSNSVVNVVSSKRMPPGGPMAKSGTNQMKMASLSPTMKGFVLDYASLNTSQTNYTFKGNTTYYISGNVNLYGTNTTFEGSTVLKYGSNFSLTVNTPVNWRSGIYRPVLMLAVDDDSCGETISGSTGNPGNNYYAAKALYFDGTSALTNLNIYNLRISNAKAGIVINGKSNHVLNNVQIVDCANGIAATNTDFSLRNALLSAVLTNFSGSTATGRVEHLTSDMAAWLNKDIGTNLFLTNCLLSAVTNLGSCATQSVAVVSSGSGVFQAIGAGDYYLMTNSPYRNVGTTNINAALLAQLSQKTTYPPTVYSNVIISIATTLSPQVQRDSDVPDLGFHYDPIDYLVERFWFTNTSVTINAGTAIACFNDSGIFITDGGYINSVGTATAPVWFTRYSAVQEQPLNIGSPFPTNAFPGNGSSVNSYHATNAPSGQFRFTKFTCPAGGGLHLGDNSYFAGYTNILVQDCEFWAGDNFFSGYNYTTALLENNLFARSTMTAIGGVFTSNSLSVSNNLFWNTTTTVRSGANSNAWFFFNNVFDNSAIQTNGFQGTINGYNGYIGVSDRLFPTSVNDVVSTNAFPYQSGPLGYFYQPTNSVLINVGSVTANLNSLYHFTTTTNQVKETNSVVDIGYHYVALDALGNAFDTDGDGIPDYLEDSNGNGIFDVGDLGDWQIGQYNGLSYGSGLQVFTPLK